jgi:hypothetical protein
MLPDVTTQKLRNICLPTYDVPASYKNSAMYYSVPSYYTEDCHTTEASKYCTTTYVAPAYTTKAAEYYTTKAAEYYTNILVFFTTTYAAPEYYTDAPKYYTTEVI